MPAKSPDDDDQPATEAGAANAETEVVDDEGLREAAGGKAWSDAVDDAGDDEPESHPWSVVTGQAAVLISVGAAVAAITVMVGWLVLHDDRPAPSPAAEKSTSSAAAPAPVPPSTVTITATTQTSTQTSTRIAASGPIMGSPCNSGDHGKLAAAGGTGQEIFCNADQTGEGTWQATPSDVTGVYIMYTACEGLQTGDKLPLARSTDGYLIACEPASYAGPPGGSGLVWQRYRAIFDPGT